jgi:hypothetical protein
MPLTKNSTNKLRREGEKLACFLSSPTQNTKNLITELFFFFFFLFVTRGREEERERFLLSPCISEGHLLFQMACEPFTYIYLLPSSTKI